MPEIDIFDPVKASNVTAVEELLKSGAHVNQVDKHGWTPLNWAAGRGNLKMVQLLVDQGADILKVGIDQRTAYMIALAAGHAEVARFLKQVEDRTPGEKIPYPERKYCKAYHLKQFRQFLGWVEKRPDAKKETKKNGNPAGTEDESLPDAAIAYLHQDYRVSRSMWNDENVIFDQVTSEWKQFCTNVLSFRVPDDFDLIVPPVSGKSATSSAS